MGHLPHDDTPAGGLVRNAEGRASTPERHRAARRVGAGAGVLGGLGATVGFFLPWFVFVAAVWVGCHGAYLQVQTYLLPGVALLFNVAEKPTWVLAGVVFLCAVAALVIALVALRQPSRRAAISLLTLALVGMGALVAAGVLASNGLVWPSSAGLEYIHYLGWTYGFWVTLGSFFTLLIGGAVLHAEMRSRPARAPIVERTLIAVGLLGLVASTTGAFVIQPAAPPSLTCATSSTAQRASGPPLYVTSPDRVYALDETSGATIWSCDNPLGGVVTDGPPALSAGALIVASRDGYVYAIRARDAAILWRADVGGRGAPVAPVARQQSLAPIVAHGVVYGINGAGSVYALRLSDGASAWPRTAAPPHAALWVVTPIAAPVDAAGVFLYLAGDATGVRATALDDQTGRVLWQAPVSRANGSEYPRMRASIVVAQGAVYDEETGSRSSGLDLVSRSLTDGVARWRYALTQPSDLSSLTAFTLANGIVYLAQPTPGSAHSPAPYSVSDPVTLRVVALRTSDGATIWSGPPLTLRPSVLLNQIGPGQVTVTATASAAFLAFTWQQGNEAKGALAAFDAAHGSIRWRAPVSLQGAGRGTFGPTNLMAVGRSLYLLDLSSGVVSLDAASGARNWRLTASDSAATAQTAPAIISAPLAPGELAPTTLYVAIGRLYALNPTTGVERWRVSPVTPTSPYGAGAEFRTPLLSEPTLS